MKAVLNGYIKLTDFINKVAGIVIAILLAIMSVLIFWQVFTRYVMGDSFSYAEELSRFMMVWLALLGAAYAFSRNSLISMDLLVSIKKPGFKKLQVVVKVVVQLLSILFATILLYYGWELSMTISGQHAPATGISMFWVALSMPVSSAIIIMNALKHLLKVKDTTNGGD